MLNSFRLRIRKKNARSNSVGCVKRGSASLAYVAEVYLSKNAFRSGVDRNSPAIASLDYSGARGAFVSVTSDFTGTTRSELFVFVATAAGGWGEPRLHANLIVTEASQHRAGDS